MTIHTGVSTWRAQLLLSHTYGNFWTITARHQLCKYNCREDHRLPFSSGTPEEKGAGDEEAKKEGLTTHRFNNEKGFSRHHRRALLFQCQSFP